MVRDTLAMVQLLNRETLHHPDAPARRAAVRDGGHTAWDLREELVAEDLRGVLPEAAAADELPGYDPVLPMEPGAAEHELPATRLTLRRIG